MKIRVIEPESYMLTSVDDARKQFARCAYAAGISRGRVHDVYETGGTQVSGAPVALRKVDEIELTIDSFLFENAENLLRKLLSFKPHPHESVLEHSAVSFLFQCSRIATHEIVRHRVGVAFTQSSTRYIEERDEITLIKPPHMPEEDLGEYDLRTMYCHPVWLVSAAESCDNYRSERERGVKRESARYLLPHCLKADIVVTANFRQWRHMIRLRTSKKAAPEMQLLFNQVKDDLTTISHVLTEDL